METIPLNIDYARFKARVMRGGQCSHHDVNEGEKKKQLIVRRRSKAIEYRTNISLGVRYDEVMNAWSNGESNLPVINRLYGMSYFRRRAYYRQILIIIAVYIVLCIVNVSS